MTRGTLARALLLGSRAIIAGGVLAACSQGNTGALDLFPPSHTAAGGSGGTACSTNDCSAGGGGASTGGTSHARGGAGGPDVSDDHADASTSRIDAAQGTACSADRECSGSSSTPLCVSGRCVACRVRTDCKGITTFVCVSNRCVACEPNDDCGGK